MTKWRDLHKQYIEKKLRAIPRLQHDDGDYVLPDYPALTEFVISLTATLPSDMCICGWSAFEAIGDDLFDHEKTCVVYLTARIKRLEIVIDSCCSEPGLTSWEIVNRLQNVIEEGL